MAKEFKMVIGILLIAVGAFLLSQWWGDFWSLFRGAVPAILILLGVLIVWIEWEEMKGPPKPPIKRKK